MSQPDSVDIPPVLDSTEHEHIHRTGARGPTWAPDGRQRRDSARTVVLDREGRVLLINVLDPHDDKPPLWITPGGGVEPGEDLATAATRELREETGFVASSEELGEPVAMCEGEWEFRGRLLYSQDWYFSLQTDNFEPSDAAWDEIEREIHTGWRWWAAADLEGTAEAVIPAGLPDLARLLHAGAELPSRPLVLPWKVI